MNLKKALTAVFSTAMVLSMATAMSPARAYEGTYGDFKINDYTDYEGYKISDYENKEMRNVTIPSYINAKAVSEIDYGAFSSKKSLETINIPETVQRIDYYAFKDCVNLKNVNFTGASKLKEISYDAFRGCDALANRWIKVNNTYLHVKGDTDLDEDGLKTIDGKSYYFKNCFMQKGWHDFGYGYSWSEKEWHYFGQDGAGKTKWAKIGNQWYWFGDDGLMQTGWIYTGGRWYYLKSSGAMATGWANDGKNWYYFDSNGVMETGWIKVGGSWYYLNGSGAMQSNRWIGNYYVTGSGAMATNRWIGNYYVGNDGAYVKDRWIGRYHVNGSGVWDRTR